MNIALILSGGMGTRLGADIPKQYIKVDNKMIISYCMQTIVEHPLIDGVWIVADKLWQDLLRKEFLENGIAMEKFCGFSNPGNSRQESILNGLADIRKQVREEAYVLIHDAARPLLSDRLISDCLKKVVGHDGLMPVIPVNDTMYLTDMTGKKIECLVDRERLVAGQAPEVFSLEKYYRVNADMTREELSKVHGSTEPAYEAGFDMVLISGEEINFKVTTPSDLDRFRQIVFAQRTVN